MSMRPSIYEWYGRHPDLLDGLTDAEVAYLMGESDEVPPSFKDWNEEDHPRVPAGSSEGGQFTESGGGSSGGSDDGVSEGLPPLRGGCVIGQVILKGLDAKMTEKVTDTIRGVYHDYDLPRLEAIHTSDEDQATGPLIVGTPTALTYTGVLMLNSTWMGNENKMRGRASRAMKEGRKSVKLAAVMGGLKDKDAEVMLRTLGSGVRMYVNMSPRGVILHELGHMMARSLKRNADFKAGMRSWKVGAKWVSVRSMFGQNEYAAEAFVAHVMGENIKNDRLKAAFESRKR